MKFEAKDYLQHLAEHVEPYSYLVYPYLKGVGWKGFVDGKDSGVYRASPLARLNAADGMATPLAQAEYERMYEHARRQAGARHAGHALGAPGRAACTPPSAPWSWRSDPEIIDPNVSNIPTGIVGEGVGCVEAPRGTLYHHYKTDEKGIVTAVNLIVGTTNNNAAISMSLKKAAEGLIKQGRRDRRGPAEHGRDGLPRLRPVLRLRHAQLCRARCRWR